MRAYKLQVQIEADHQLSMRLPEDFPSGPAEVIALVREANERKPLRLVGTLAPTHRIDKGEGDPIADALHDLRTNGTPSMPPSLNTTAPTARIRNLHIPTPYVSEAFFSILRGDHRFQDS
jgi:hypothetical protein